MLYRAFLTFFISLIIPNILFAKEDISELSEQQQRTYRTCKPVLSEKQVNEFWDSGYKQEWLKHYCNDKAMQKLGPEKYRLYANQELYYSNRQKRNGGIVLSVLGTIGIIGSPFVFIAGAWLDVWSLPVVYGIASIASISIGISLIVRGVRGMRIAQKRIRKIEFNDVSTIASANKLVGFAPTFSF